MLTRKGPFLPAWPAALLSALALSAAAWAGGDLAGAPPDDAQIAAAAARVDGIDVPDNALVAAALADLTGNPRTRLFLQSGVANRAEHAALVDDALARHGLPAALAAVPLIESGYVNLGAGASGPSLAPGIPGKGLWMFIPATARQYGLIVEEGRDDRLDERLETEAACRLLADLHAEFGDWGLALAGYNQGSRRVRQAVADHGTRDVWALIEAGALNDYAAHVYAAMLILADPSLVE